MTLTSTSTSSAITDFQFDLDGGRACLDFANTLSASGEHLNTYADLVAFAEQSHLLTRDDAAWLRAEAGRDPVSAEGVLVRAKRLRQSMFAIFAAIAEGKPAPERDLDLLNFDLAASMSHARVLPNAAASGAGGSGSGGSGSDAGRSDAGRSGAGGSGSGVSG